MTTHPATVNDGSPDDARKVNVEPMVYQICVRGRLTARLAAAMEGMTMQAGAVDTVFTGEVRDQSELYGLLNRLRDLGLELISAQPQAAARQDPDA